MCNLFDRTSCDYWGNTTETFISIINSCDDKVEESDIVALQILKTKTVPG